MVDGIERRKYPRISFVAPVEINYTLKDKSYHGIIKNISMGGIGIETHDFLRIDDEYEFKFLLPTGEILRPIGTVVWEHLTDSRTNLYGIKFKKIPLFQKFKLRKFIDRQLQK